MKVIIYGIGDFAELMAYYFTTDSQYEVIAFCADAKYITKRSLNGVPVVDFENIDDEFPPSKYKIFVAVGYKNMRNRQNMYLKVKKKGYKCANYISSKAILDQSNDIGDNCVILHGAILEPFAKIGNNCYINTGATICHHVTVEQGCFIAARSLIGGFSIIRGNSFIGFNATILQKLTIAQESLIAANALVTYNTEPYSKYVGLPAKKISTHYTDGITIQDKIYKGL